MLDSLNAVLALGVCAVLQIADVVTTRRILARGGRELNPIVAYLMDLVGDPGWIFAKLMFAVIAAAVIVDRDAIWLLWLLNVVMAAVVLHNVRGLRHGR
ncbi:hypothetical protein FGK63_01810 [Ruegeria sediminis]|uniref:DUF5658 domain-containing protein n=1 Tax=Ruegeria sediminis TaxID=2583820 RepID=A0ABY2X378_9RHOB|nr:DUF5658 family protein [Ruegeria sediminis]TMV09830.1 hypothetical protein FGK63_01810 [Ruegeria sediminis]